MPLNARITTNNMCSHRESYPTYGLHDYFKIIKTICEKLSFYVNRRKLFSIVYFEAHANSVMFEFGYEKVNLLLLLFKTLHFQAYNYSVQ